MEDAGHLVHYFQDTECSVCDISEGPLRPDSIFEDVPRPGSISEDLPRPGTISEGPLRPDSISEGPLTPGVISEGLSKPGNSSLSSEPWLSEGEMLLQKVISAKH